MPFTDMSNPALLVRPQLRGEIEMTTYNSRVKESGWGLWIVQGLLATYVLYARSARLSAA